MKRFQDAAWVSDMDLSLDFALTEASRVGPEGGLAPEDFGRLAEKAASVHADIEARRRAGTLGFFDLLDDAAMLAEVEAAAADYRGRVRDILVLGIGGSALGAIALERALRGPFLALSDPEAPRLFVADNIDPETFTALISTLEWERTLVVVISKSGTTAETMSQFLIVREELLRRFGPGGARERIVAVTDPAKGVLRAIAQKEGYRALSIPPAVGGRFSVLTPVGLFPAALCGMDAAELMAGARRMAARCSAPTLDENPAYRNGAVQYLYDHRRRMRIHVYFAYADALYGLADWIRQLVAESLGKARTLDGRAIACGPTPVKALGATDQHSQLQLYMEGPRDKLVTFLAPGRFRAECPIPHGFGDVEALGYLGGHSLGELLKAEQRATAVALAEGGRPSVTLTLPEVNAYTLGQAFFLFMAQTVFMGGLYGVNPLDQPGVELGKKFAYGLMGRKGFEEYRRRILGNA